ncbi:MAG: hypothetical protein AABX32_08090 [Nanoarchaeota archaeon]
MNKQGKKSNWILIAVAAAALLSLVAVAYAQESGKSHMSSNNMADMMGGKGMGEMHNQMTKNLDPNMREQADRMHESCKKEMEEDKENASDEPEMGMM